MGLSLTRVTAGAFIALCFGIFVVYWIVAAFRTKPTAERAGGPTNWLIRVILIVVLLSVKTRTGFASTLWDYTPAIGAFGVTVTALGLLILVWARATLAGNWSANVEFKEKHELIERGPYRYMRHPIYSGIILMVLGAALVAGSPTAVAALIGVPIWLWFKLSREERLLIRHFPDEYPRYRARVKALVPFVI